MNRRLDGSDRADGSDPVGRPRRLLHPGAWWLWAGGLAVVALRTTNPLLLGLVLGVVAFVVASRRSDAPWAMSFAGYLKLGARRHRHPHDLPDPLREPAARHRALHHSVGDAAGLGGGGEHRRPGDRRAAGRRVLPGPAAGGGDLLRRRGQLPLQPVPDAAGPSQRPLRGRAWRSPSPSPSPRSWPSPPVGCARPGASGGGPTSGPSAWRGSMLPVLEGRARTGGRPRRLDGLAGLRPPRARRRGRCDARRPGSPSAASCSSPSGPTGCSTRACRSCSEPPRSSPAACALAGALVVGGRRSDRTRYRPDPWLVAEWVVSACGLAAVIGVVISGRAGGAPRPVGVPARGAPAPGGRRRRRADRRALPPWVAPEPPELASVAPVRSPDLEVAA